MVPLTDAKSAGLDGAHTNAVANALGHADTTAILEAAAGEGNQLTESNALELAIELAKRGPAYGHNPQVGAVLLRNGAVLGAGWHMGAGTPHAEAAALTDAQAKGHAVAGATLVVTLEPCRHHGRTPPCTDLIQKAGIAKVVYACTDPGDTAGGGAQQLRQAGLHVEQVQSAAASELIHVWATSVKLGRPYLTVKLATSLDGRVAAADGSSQWITGAISREHAHQVRAQVDAIAVTTGTVLADNPALTARLPNGELAVHQPVRVIVGNSDIPADAHVNEPTSTAIQVRSHHIEQVLAELNRLGIRHLLVEGGPALVTACFAADVVDEIHAYLAPVVIGAGPTAVSDYGATTLGAAQRFTTKQVQRLGDDVLLVARAQH